MSSLFQEWRSQVGAVLSLQWLCCWRVQRLMKFCAVRGCSKFPSEPNGKTFPRSSVLLKFARTGSLLRLRGLLCDCVRRFLEGDSGGLSAGVFEGIPGDVISIAAIHPGGEPAS